jgi:type I restriction enzyme S subunit
MTFPRVRVGDLCDLTNGKAFKPEDWSEQGHPIIRIQNLNDPTKPFNHWNGSLDRQVAVSPNDVLLAWSGTPGTSFGAHIWKGTSGILNQHIFLVDLDQKRITKQWFVLAVNFRLNRLIALAHGGVGLKHVTRGMVDDLEISLPTIKEQEQISAILDQAEELRRKRLATLSLVDRLPETIFDHLFGASRSDSPEITLADVVRQDDRINYGVVQPGSECESGVPLVRVANVVENDFARHNLKKIEPAIESQYKRSRLHGDEILVACVGSVGAVALATSELKHANIARAVARIRVDEAKADRIYVAEYLRLGRTQRYFRTETRAVAQPTLNIKQLSETRILLPPITIQREFARRIAEVARLRSYLARHLNKLDCLFASLQHRAFNGELTTKVAERELAEAV